MVEVEVHTVGIDASWSQPLVLLRETGPQQRMLPVWVGQPEAAAMVAARVGAPVVRPDTHSLIANVLGALGHRLTGVVITELRGTVFHAELVVDGGLRIDARASDAIGLALRAGAGIEVVDAVFERASVPGSDVHESDGPTAPSGPPALSVSESELERFRREIDEASPSDFDQDPTEE